jgi:hypothetical protein
MRLLTRASLCAVLVIGAVGCGGSDPGNGSGTLFVRARAETNGNTSGTHLSVQVRRGSENAELLTDAVVIIRGDRTGQFNLPYGGDFGGAHARRDMAWDTGWELEVKHGEDHLKAYLEAPGVTHITSPLGNTTFLRAADPLIVKWTDTEGRKAEVVELRLDKAKADFATAEDKGEYRVEASRLVSEDKEKVEVRRRNEINLAGGVPGSSFRATSKHEIEFRVE